jgi:hypothetical protein
MSANKAIGTLTVAAIVTMKSTEDAIDTVATEKETIFGSENGTWTATATAIVTMHADTDVTTKTTGLVLSSMMTTVANIITDLTGIGTGIWKPSRAALMTEGDPGS